jgi:uncharacterized integral membrane protein
MNRIVAVLIVVPLAIILIALGVANRAPVALTFDPFNPGSPGLTLQMPLFVLIFGATAIGLVIGSLVTWLKQGRYRRQARDTGSSAPTGSALTRPRA